LLCIFCLHAYSQSALDIELSKVFDSEFVEDEPGGSLLIKKGDQTIFQQNYGIADIESNEKITAHTIFNTGSISKTFVANGILILAEQSKLKLNDPISKYFPDFENQDIIQHITIQHLLTHSSGIPDLRPVRQNREFYLTAKDAANFAPLKSVKELDFDPGSQFQYSNPAYNGLALIIEKVAKQPWQDFIAENIFVPAGMDESTITNGAHPTSGVAHAYVKNKGNYVESDYGETPTFAAAGNGGVWCSVLDLAKYEAATQQHRFLDKELVAASRTVWDSGTWSKSTPPFLGFGWWVNGNLLTDYTDDYVYHTGSQGGFRAFHVYLPNQDILLIGLFNRPIDNLGQLINQIVDILRKSNWAN